MHLLGNQEHRRSHFFPSKSHSDNKSGLHLQSLQDLLFAIQAHFLIVSFITVDLETAAERLTICRCLCVLFFDKFRSEFDKIEELL